MRNPGEAQDRSGVHASRGGGEGRFAGTACTPNPPPPRAPRCPRQPSLLAPHPSAAAAGGGGTRHLCAWPPCGWRLHRRL